MADIVTRLRSWVHAVDAVPASDIMDEAAVEIERLRSAVSRHTAGISAATETQNHDAAPAATAHRSGNDGPSPDSHGTGDTPPLAAGGRAANRTDGSGNRQSPHPSPVLSTPVTDDRPAPTAEPVAWGVASPSGLLCTSTCRDDASEMQCEFTCDTDVVPLYRHPSPCPYVVGTVTRYCTLTPMTLTDAEREAVIHAMAALDHVGTDWTLQCAATLRALLERLK